MIQIADSTPAKAVRKRSAKPSQMEDASKVKATIHLSAEAAKRLGVYAVMTGKSNSGVVEALIMEQLRRFVVSDRAKSSDEAMSSVSAS